MTPEEQLDEARATEVLRRLVNSGPVVGAREIAALGARLARENWTPPEPVDPDLLAWREWAAMTYPSEAKNISAGRWDKMSESYAYLAGARTAREQERERAKVLVECCGNLQQFSGWADGQRAAQALAKYRGEA